jgi:hypothetical protein
MLTFIGELLQGSVTRRLAKESAQFCPKIAQNGALVNKNFCPKKYLVKIREFYDKTEPQYRADLDDFFETKLRPNYLGDIFQKRMHPTPKSFAQMAKFRPIWSHWFRKGNATLQRRIVDNLAKVQAPEVLRNGLFAVA